MRPWRLSLARWVLAFTLVPALALAQNLRFTTMDVGQGDAAVLIAPGGCAALFDGGPTGSGTTLKTYLQSLGVTRVQMAFVSHLHADHMGGLDEVDVGTNAVPIDAVYDHGGTYASGTYNEYASHFAGRRFAVQAGQTFSLCGQVTLEIIAAGGSSSDENARSVVVKISYGAFDALVGGDLTGSSPDMESGIASAVGELELYKVHHHGSKYSSNATFLAATQPLVSFISVGLGNPYGHPAPETLARLAGVGSDVWLTEDPSLGRVNGHIALTSATGSTFTVSQGGTSIPYTSKGATPDTQSPSAPQGLVATAASSSAIDLSWSPSTDDVGVTSYSVYRSTNGGSFTLAGTSPTTGFADMGLASSTPYWYRVTASDAAGNTSAESNTATATTSAPPSTPGEVILNEILANEVGSNTGTEFVELVNVGGTPVDISGWTLRDASAVRHTFASGTRLAPSQALVVFASGSAIPGGLSNAVAASTGSLSLNNTGDTVSLRNGSKTITSYSYSGSLASVDGVSMNRSPDATASGAFVLHTTLSALSASPGTSVSGGAF